MPPVNGMNLSAQRVAFSKKRDRPPELRLRDKIFVEILAHQLDLQLLAWSKVAQDDG